MRLKLHATGCRKLKAVDGRPTEYRDTLVRGLVLRVRGRGAGTFSAVYWFGGRNRRVTLGRVGKTSLSAARALARQLFLEVVAGRDPATERRRARFARTTLPQTVDELVSRCFAALDLRPSTRAEWKRIAKVEISPVLGRRPAVELTRGEVRAWRDAIRGRSRNVAQTSMAVLRRVYRWALEEDLLASSPCAGLAVTVPRPRTSRWLRAGELRALWEALGRVAPGSPFPDVVRLLLLTAVRRGEALGARREEFHDLEGEDARWIIPGERMKAGLEHLVPLSRQAIEVVRRRLEAVTGSCLFPALDGDRSIRWPPRFAQLLHDETLGCLREDLDDPAAKLERWTIHCIRHTVATHMQDILKVPDAVIALVLAHRPPGLTDVDGIYLRGRRLDERREALQRWANWLVATAEGAKRGAAGGRSDSSISSGSQVA